MISTVPVVSGSLSINPLAALTPFGVFQIVRWLSGNRHTEDLVPGVSFPGHDEYGNWIGFPDYDEIYQYADFVTEVPVDLVVDALTAGVPLVNAPAEINAMQILRLFLVQPNGTVDTGATYPGCSPDNLRACVPIQFGSVTEMAIYAENHGEIPRPVSSTDEAFQIAADQDRQRQALAQATSASQPTGTVSAGATPSPVLRFILKNGDVWDSGAGYPSCSRSNPAGCMPQQFGSLQAALQYAQANGEVLYQVDSLEEAWLIVEGKAGIVQNKIISNAGLFAGLSAGALVAGAAALMFLLRRR